MKNLVVLSTVIILTLSCTLVNKSADTAQDARDIAATGAVLDKTGYKFDTKDTSCGGFPRLKVQTMPGTCLGMVFGNYNTQGADGKTMFRMPRNITKVPGTDDFLVTDMGGWANKIGSLFWIRFDPGAKKYTLIRALKELDYPHGLTFNEHDGYFYIGERNAIFRFHFSDGKVTDKKFVVQNLPDTAKHMHPLTQFVFDPKTGDLYVNSGAPTDHCYQESKNYKERCPDEIALKMGTIQKITRAQLDNLPAQGIKPADVQVVAKGLRNSMALAIHPFGRFLVQGENSRDFPELEEPYEEMNLIRLDQPNVVKHYGWPYCYNNHGESPEWEDILIEDGNKKYTLPPTNNLKSEHGNNPFYCGRQAIQGRKEYQRPLTLIPPHAAPLGANYYEGEMFKDLFLNQFTNFTNVKPTGVLLMSWHGYRTTGQRFVMYPVNAQGLPIPSKQGKRYYNFNMPNGCPKPAPFNPRGGLRDHFVDYQEIISGWGPLEGTRPRGAPVGFTTANDGSIWIVDDKNKSIVRLAATEDPKINYQQDGCDQAPGQNKDYNVPLLVWRNALLTADPKLKLLEDFNLVQNGLKKDKFACATCHDKLINADLNSDFKTNPDALTTMDYFIRTEWVEGGKPEVSKMYTSVSQLPGSMPMPADPGEFLQKSQEGKELLKVMERWIKNLPTKQDIAKRAEQATITQAALNIRLTPGTAQGPCGQFKQGDMVYIDPRPESKVVNGKFTWSKVYMVPGHSKLAPNACPYPLDGVFWIAK